MVEWTVPIVIALVAAAPGILAYRASRIALKADAHSRETENLTQQHKTAVEGFAELVEQLRLELERTRDDCHQRLVQAEADCRTRVERVRKALEERIDHLQREQELTHKSLHRIEEAGKAALERDKHVAADLAARYLRADAVHRSGEPGEAADAASRSEPALTEEEET